MLTVLIILCATLSACFQDNSVEARMERAQEYVNDNDYTAAIIEYKNILKDDNGNSVAREKLAKLFFEQGLYKNAKDEFLKVKEISSGKQKTKEYLWTLYYLGEYEKIIEGFSKATELNIPQDQLNLILANAYIGIHQYDLGEEYLEKVNHGDDSSIVQTSYAKSAFW